MRFWKRKEQRRNVDSADRSREGPAPQSIESYRADTVTMYRKNDPTVRVLYKYQAVRGYTMRTLAAGDIYLAKYAELNDPFDPFLSVLVQLYGLDGLTGRRPGWELVETWSAVGVVCLSEDPANQLMWAHYADAYRGFCLGYAVRTHPLVSLLHRVNYRDSMPTKVIQADAVSAVDLLQYFLLIKSQVWSYEREWRYLASPPGLQQSLFPVVEVIVGPRMPDETRKALQAAVAATRPFIKQAVPVVKKGSFRIEIETLSQT